MAEVKKPRNPILRGGAVLAAGNAVSQVLSLVRNLIVARMVAPEDFGVAVTFALTLSVLEAAFAHGFDKLLIQDSDGEDETLQSMLQTALVLRGALIGTIMLIGAPWIAYYFDIPEATRAYQILALVPVIRGFLHLDVKRIQRKMSFGPDLSIRLSAQFSGIVVAAVLAWLWQSYWAMLWAVLAQVMIETLLSHVVASRRYGLGWNPLFTNRILAFTIPLMINGIVMILSAQGTQVVIGGQLSVTDLAVYSASAMLAGAGLAFLARVAGDLGLPWIAATKGDADLYRRRHGLLGAAIAMSTVIIFAPLVLVGMDITVLLFGPDYRGPLSMMAWLALGTGLRYLRVWPIVTAMSLGDTRNLMLSNMARATGVGFVVILIWLGYGVSGAAAGAALAEGLATLISFWRLHKLPSDDLVPGRKYLSFVLVGFAIVMGVGVMTEMLALRIFLALMIPPVTVWLAFFLEPGLKGFFLSIIRALQGKIRRH